MKHIDVLGFFQGGERRRSPGIGHGDHAAGILQQFWLLLAWGDRAFCLRSLTSETLGLQ